MEADTLSQALERICRVFARLADRDLFPWLENGYAPNDAEQQRAATIVADRLCGAFADPIIRNAQESRQLTFISHFLEARVIGKYRRTATNWLHICRQERSAFGAMFL
jgi:hypothetical protein